jgi:hypothetical protein
MDFVKATIKIHNSIDTAKTLEHHQIIEVMIDNVEKYARLQKPRDETILGALAMLNWENVDKWHKKNKR